MKVTTSTVGAAELETGELTIEQWKMIYSTVTEVKSYFADIATTSARFERLIKKATDDQSMPFRSRSQKE